MVANLKLVKKLAFIPTFLRVQYKQQVKSIMMAGAACGPLMNISFKSAALILACWEPAAGDQFSSTCAAFMGSGALLIASLWYTCSSSGRLCPQDTCPFYKLSASLMSVIIKQIPCYIAGRRELLLLKDAKPKKGHSLSFSHKAKCASQLPSEIPLLSQSRPPSWQLVGERWLGGCPMHGQAWYSW